MPDFDNIIPVVFNMNLCSSTELKGNTLSLIYSRAAFWARFQRSISTGFEVKNLLVIFGSCWNLLIIRNTVEYGTSSLLDISEIGTPSRCRSSSILSLRESFVQDLYILMSNFFSWIQSFAPFQNELMLSAWMFRILRIMGLDIIVFTRICFISLLMFTMFRCSLLYDKMRRFGRSTSESGFCLAFDSFSISGTSKGFIISWGSIDCVSGL